jgi:cysteine desulfurase
MKPLHIYADNASTTQLDPDALEAMLPFLRDDFANPSALHTGAKKARHAVEDARRIISECIGAKPHEIIFTSCGTESDNWAIKGVARSLDPKHSKFVTCAIEHHAVLNCFDTLERKVFSTAILPVDSDGVVSVNDLEEAIKDTDAGLLSIMLANNEIGTIQDIPALAEIAHRHNLLVHTDAMQAVGHLPLDVKQLNIDLLSASAHKFNGPKGVGFLYKRDSVKLPPMIDGGHQESGLRAGTENVSGIVGTVCALRKHVEHLGSNMEHLRKLEVVVKSVITEGVPEARFNGHPERHLPGLLSLSLPGMDAEGLLHILDIKGVAVSTGAACNSKETVLSHVLRAIRLPVPHASGTIRISFSRDNTEAEATALAGFLARLYRNHIAEGEKKQREHLFRA